MTMASGGDEFIHNESEDSGRQNVLNDECFRDTSVDAMHRTGIVDAAVHQAHDYKLLEIGCGLTTMDISRQMETALEDQQLEEIVDLERHPLESDDFRESCKRTLESEGVLVLDGFLNDAAIDTVRLEGVANKHLALLRKL